MKKKYPFSNIFYLCVHKRLIEKHHRKMQLSQKEFFQVLGRLYHVPKKFKLLILKEMELLGMLTIINSNRQKFVKLNRMKSDPEIDVNKFYEELGVF